MKLSTTRYLIAPLLILGLTACGETAELSPIQEERHENFESFGDAMKAIKDELDKDAPSLEAIAPNVETIASKAPNIPTWFPEGSGEGTDALPAVWEQPDVFAERAEALAATSANLRAAVESGDVEAVRAGYGEMGMSCKNCHDTFREDDD